MVKWDEMNMIITVIVNHHGHHQFHLVREDHEGATMVSGYHLVREDHEGIETYHVTVIR